MQNRCLCYKDENNQVALLREFDQDTEGVVEIMQQQVVFVTNGSGRITILDSDISRTLKKWEFFFLPGGVRLSCDFKKNTSLLIVRIDSEHSECQFLSKPELTEQEIDSRTLNTLVANKRIRDFATGLQETINDGFRCSLYMKTEVYRMMFLFNAYYSLEERKNFFSHILTPDVKFSEFVRLNHSKYRTVGEMANALFMTQQAFSIRFKKVFGLPPHQWLLREKARNIHMDICKNELSLKQISIKYDFPVTSHFYRFCKKNFGDTPGNIRKGMHVRPHYKARKQDGAQSFDA
jgi:AraC-like DNA-binding protein